MGLAALSSALVCILSADSKCHRFLMAKRFGGSHDCFSLSPPPPRMFPLPSIFGANHRKGLYTDMATNCGLQACIGQSEACLALILVQHNHG